MDTVMNNDIAEFFGERAKVSVSKLHEMLSHVGNTKTTNTISNMGFIITDELSGCIAEKMRNLELPWKGNIFEITTPVENVHDLFADISSRFFYVHNNVVVTHPPLEHEQIPVHLRRMIVRRMMQIALSEFVGDESLTSPSSDMSHILFETRNTFVPEGSEDNIFLGIMASGYRINFSIGGVVRLIIRKNRHVANLYQTPANVFKTPVLMTLAGKRKVGWIETPLPVDPVKFTANLEEIISRKIMEFVGGENDLGFTLTHVPDALTNTPDDID